MLKENLVVGPSHVVRLESAIANRQVYIYQNVEFLGWGGLPCWHPKCNRYLNGDNINEFLFVGDFRFGNKFLESGKPAHGIRKELINPENDIQLFSKSLNALNNLVNPNTYLIFWCLATRESGNRINNKYYSNGQYNHPIWNLEDLEDKYKENTICLADIISSGEFEKLYIDKSGHPSLLGYLFLIEIIRLKPKSGKETLRLFKVLDELFSKFINDFNVKSTIILGENIFSRHINYFKSRLLIGEDFECYDSFTYSDIEQFLDNNITNKQIIIVSSLSYKENSVDSYNSKLTRHLDLIETNPQIKFLFWNSYADAINVDRGIIDKPIPTIYSYFSLTKLFNNNIVKLPEPSTLSAQSLVEINAVGQPTLKAILYIYESSFSTFQMFEKKYDFLIKNIKVL